MKYTYLLKIFLLTLPVLILIYVFLIRDRLSSGNSIGGGSYDLTKMYTVIGVGLYLLIFELALLIQNAGENKFFLLAGFILLIIIMVMATRILS